MTSDAVFDILGGITIVGIATALIEDRRRLEEAVWLSFPTHDHDEYAPTYEMRPHAFAEFINGMGRNFAQRMREITNDG